MAVRIPMTPDADGIIKLSCNGQEIEILVTAAAAPPKSDPPGGDSGAVPDPNPSSPGPGFGAKPPRAKKKQGKPPQDKSGIDWSRILGPGTLPHVTMVPFAGADHVDDDVLQLKLEDKQSAMVFLADKSVNLHDLYRLGSRMQKNGLTEQFNVVFGDDLLKPEIF